MMRPTKEEANRIQKRQSTLEQDLEQVELSLKINYDIELRAESIRAACQRLAGVLDTATDDDWRGLFRDLAFRVILQPEQPHIMRVALEVEPSEEFLPYCSTSTA
ncbi:MAG: hypothetical protein L0177_03340 [Chloroflexi bacterium]|nr:hypothetical protein [Chloroflexota bacterium]